MSKFGGWKVSGFPPSLRFGGPAGLKFQVIDCEVCWLPNEDCWLVYGFKF